MPLNFPYDYGDDLTIEQAKQNLKNHSKEIILILPFLILTIGAPSYAADVPPANGANPADGPLKSSMERKALEAAKNQSPLVGIPKPTSQTGRCINTGLLVGAMGIVCQNAMWTGNPALILGCAAVTVGFMFPNLLAPIAGAIAKGK